MSSGTPDDGNVAQDGGNAGGHAGTGTPGATDRNAEQDANIAALAKAQQETIAKERAARREAEAEIERLRRAQSPAAQRPTAETNAEKLERARAWAEGRGVVREDGRDDVASLALDLAEQLEATREELRATQLEVGHLRALDRIGDEEERAEVEEHFKKNRHRLGDVAAARAEVREKKLAEQLKAQQEEAEKLRATLAANARASNPDVVRTLTRDVTAAELKTREPTRAEWEARQAALDEAEAAGDVEAGKLKRKEQLQYRRGEIHVRG